ncbi:MAG: hypothetical protein N2109_09960 [Fimbriimonadales bacterium]|nr:hypothetical protein [Fimbriimonadales bacterium]
MRSGRLDLGGEWRLACTEDFPEALVFGPMSAAPWFGTLVPEPVHLALMRAGMLPDLEHGRNTLAARWVEDAFWVYRRSFEAPREAIGLPCRLVLELVECHATVFLNGEKVGSVCNAHRPHRLRCESLLREGTNEIAVVVQSGEREVIDRPVTGWIGDRTSLTTRRNWLRKPQYQCGWDWNPRLVNVGLLGPVRLEWGPVFLDGVGLVHRLSDDLREADAELLLELDSALPEGQLARVEWAIPSVGSWTETELVVGPGPQLARSGCRVLEPPLWSPAGAGEPKTVGVRWRLSLAGEGFEGTLRTGFRKVEIDQPPAPEGGSLFVLKVNGRPVFCKGGNLVPADLLYSTTPAERWRRLAAMARDANMNLLRVWGGGHYLAGAMAEACDELGLMVWHDFAYACAKTDASDPFLWREAELEARHQTLRLSAHPSIVVWCGNNEVLQGDEEWSWAQMEPRAPHRPIFFELLPRVVGERSPHVPYWPGSPWSPDGSLPNNPNVGDQHPWGVSLGDRFADWWAYRSFTDRFPNEGGVLGSSLPKTLMEFLPVDQRRVHSPAWRHHDNTFAWTPHRPELEGRAYLAFREWTGLDPADLPLDEFALLSGVLQADGLDEYIRNYRRRMFSSASAVFWMYNDSWPVSMGWTTQDHRLRRKPSYHAVRRAFAPVAVVVADEGDRFGVYGVNDTNRPAIGGLRAGVFRLAGAAFASEELPVELPPNASTRLTEVAAEDLERVGVRHGGVAAVLRLQDGTTLQHRLFRARFRELAFAEPSIRVAERDGGVEFESDSFVWGVLTDLDGETPWAESCFDLLPGVPFAVPRRPGQAEPRPLWTASGALLRAHKG